MPIWILIWAFGNNDTAQTVGGFAIFYSYVVCKCAENLPNLGTTQEYLAKLRFEKESRSSSNEKAFYSKLSLTVKIEIIPKWLRNTLTKPALCFLGFLIGWVATEQAKLFTQFNLQPGKEMDVYLENGMEYSIKANPVRKCNVIELAPLKPTAGEVNEEKVIMFDRFNRIAYYREMNRHVFNWYASDIRLIPNGEFTWKIMVYGGTEYDTDKGAKVLADGDRMARNDLNSDGIFDNPSISAEKCTKIPELVPVAENFKLTLDKKVGKKFKKPNLKISGNSNLCQLRPVPMKGVALELVWNQPLSGDYSTNGYTYKDEFLFYNEPSEHLYFTDFTNKSIEMKKKTVDMQQKPTKSQACCMGFGLPPGKEHWDAADQVEFGSWTITVEQYQIKCNEPTGWTSEVSQVFPSDDRVNQHVSLNSLLLEIPEPEMCTSIEIFFSKNSSDFNFKGNVVSLMPIYGLIRPTDDDMPRVINLPLEERNMFRLNALAGGLLSIEYEIDSIGSSTTKEYMSLQDPTFQDGDSPGTFYIFMQHEKRCRVRLLNDDHKEEFKKVTRCDMKQRFEVTKCECVDDVENPAN